ncbi:MAG: signal peptidase I [Planctomycetes bacterium]|nr:signal peptidase I [Planctomycetota bacterium]
MSAKRSRHAVHYVRAVLLIALLTICLGLLTFTVIDVSGPSMAPSLYGLSDGAILVARWPYWLGSPRRFDTVVFQHPVDKTRRLVKRVAGLPGEELWIQFGELLIDGRLLQKSDEEWERVRVLLFDLRAHDPAEFWGIGDAIREVLGAGRMRLDSGTVTMDYRRADGTRCRGHQPIADVEVDLTLERGPASVSRGSLELPPGVSLRWEWAENTGVAEVIEERTGETLERFGLQRAGERLVLRFRQVDERLHLTVEGGREQKLLLHWSTDLERPIDFAELHDPRIRIGLEGAGTRILDLRVWRDLYYTSTEDRFGVRRPIALGEGAFFMLGDNSVISSDSREFGEISRRAILGRVDWVVSPWNRIRAIP